MGAFSFFRSWRGTGHDGGDHSGRNQNQNWTPVDGGGEQINQMSRDVVRSRARDLERNSDHVGALVDAMERNVVGTGIKLQAKIINPDGSDNEELNDQIEELWRVWCKPENCDISGRMSLIEMQEMATRRRLVDGGLIFIKCGDAAAKIPFKLQLKEVDDLDTSITTFTNGTAVNKVVAGIELDAVGKTAAYHFKEYDLYGWTGKSVRVQAEHVIYLSHRTRPSEIRELSPLAKILTRLRDLNQYMQAVSVKERVLACLSVFIKKVNGAFFGNQKNQQPRNQSTGYRSKKLTPGMIETLDAGDEIQVVNPSGQASNAREFFTMMLRSIGASLGLSYEATSRDMSQVNYSSARQGLIDDHATYQRQQAYLVTHFLEPVYEEFLTRCVLAGLVKIPDFFTRRDWYARCKFIPKGMPWIDPYKEARANAIALKTGQTNLEIICAAKGDDYREVLRQRAVEIKYMEELGIPVPKEGDSDGESLKSEMRDILAILSEKD